MSFHVNKMAPVLCFSPFNFLISFLSLYRRDGTWKHGHSVVEMLFVLQHSKGNLNIWGELVWEWVYSPSPMFTLHTHFSGGAWLDSLSIRPSDLGPYNVLNYVWNMVPWVPCLTSKVERWLQTHLFNGPRPKFTTPHLQSSNPMVVKTEE